VPFYSLGEQGYMEILVGYKAGILPEYFLGSFLLSPTSLLLYEVLLRYE
jgi:hypothetical protein